MNKNNNLHTKTTLVRAAVFTLLLLPALSYAAQDNDAHSAAEHHHEAATSGQTMQGKALNEHEEHEHAEDADEGAHKNHSDDEGSHDDHESHDKQSEDNAHDDHGDEHGGHGEEAEAGHVEVDPERAKRAGITVAIAGPQVVTESLRLYGRTTPDPQRVSHVQARFPGLIRSIKPALGDSVKAGDSIASIEGNQSLQRYTIRAPISGTVVERHANAGEFAGDESLMTIADYSRLWVSLSVFPREAERLRAGQRVRLHSGSRNTVTEISFLNPGEGNRPSVMARLPLDNSDGIWTPGLLVEADVIVSQQTVPIAVDNHALQRLEENVVVFVQKGEGFEAVPVTLGKRDSEYSEVLAGLQPGQRYAVANSYLLKAELGKAGASHDH